MADIQLKEGHLEILSRLKSSEKKIYAIDLISLNLSASNLTDLFKWGLIRTAGNKLETIGPYQLTNMGKAYLEKILKYASKELSSVV